MWYLYIGAVLAIIVMCIGLCTLLWPSTTRIDLESASHLLGILVLGPPLTLIGWPVLVGVCVAIGCMEASDRLPRILASWYNRRVDGALARQRAREEAAKARRLDETKYFP